MDKDTVIGVIGAGTMGAGIAQVAAIAGHQVFLTDANPAMLSRAREMHQRSLDSLAEKGKIPQEKISSVLSAINYVENISSLEKAGVVLEAIMEDLEEKQKLFSGLESIVSESCMLASNTSSLSIASVAAGCQVRGRILGVHFFNPAPLMPLVEIVPALTTDISFIPPMCELMVNWGKIPVIAKDTPGFIVNRIARPYYGESIRIFEEGIADMATIDWALKEQGGFRMGPFELMDFIGNDVNFKVTETVWEQFFYDPRYRPSLTQKRLFEAGMFGRKSGNGYYNYSPSAAKPEPVKDTVLASGIFMRVLAMLVNEAVEALYLKIASRDDIDLAMTKGVNYPKGLLKWADELGCGVILETLETLQQDYGEDRYRPCIMLKKMAAGKNKFYP